MIKVGTILQDDENFLVEVINWHSSLAVRKTVKPTTPKARADRLKNDVLGMRFFTELAKNNQNLNLYVPKLYESSDSFYICEYIDNERLLEESSSFDEAKPRLDRLIQLLVALDQIKPDKKIGYVGSSDYHNLEPSIPRWVDENIADRFITVEEGERAKKLSVGLGKYLQPRIAHGDMSAYKHTFLLPDGKVALIDFEVFTTSATRYFDVAWTFTRLWSFASTTEIPRYFLDSFIKQSEPAEHKDKQLFTVILQRTLGMQRDAHGDLISKRIDYCDRAKELLGLVLQNELELLHVSADHRRPEPTSDGVTKAIIFDFFGVVSSRSIGKFVEDYFGGDPDKLEKINQLRRQSDLGHLSRQELIKQMADLAGVSVETVEAYQSRLQINKELVAYIRDKLKSKYKIAILSNAAGDYAPELLTKEELALFNDILVSYKFGLAKPDPEIYFLAAKRLSVQPQECVLIDDKQASVEQAKSLGMPAIWYRDFSQMKKELEALLAVSNN